MRISDWSSDVCSSDLLIQVAANEAEEIFEAKSGGPQIERARGAGLPGRDVMMLAKKCRIIAILTQDLRNACGALWNFRQIPRKARGNLNDIACRYSMLIRSEEHTSELQSLMRISYAVFFLKNKKQTHI